MYKVVVYSKDKLASLGIRHFLFWEKYGFTVINEVFNPEDLLSINKNHLPDLIFIDVDSVTNFEIFEMIKKHRNRAELIIIGNNVEDLVKKHSNLELLDFIDRKKLTQDILIKKLDSYSELLSKRTEKKSDEDLKHKKEILLAAQSQVLKEIFYGRRLGVELNKDVLNNFNISFPYNTYVVLMTNNNALLGLYNNNNVRFYQEICIPGGIVYICNTGINEISFIYNFKHEDETDLKIKIDRMGARIISIMKNFYNVNNPVFISHPFYKLINVKNAYIECSNAYKVNRVLTSNLIIYCDSIKSNVEDDINPMLESMLTILKVSLKERDPLKIKLNVSNFINDIHRTDYVELSQLKYLLSCIIYLVNDFILKIGYDKKLFWGLKKTPYDKVDNLESKDDFIEFVSFISEKIINVIENHEKSNVYITKMKDYIKRNYMHDINMKDIASELELTSSYISAIFKKITGQTYKEYIINFRLSKAKELLSNTNMHINLIAEQVGYENEHYFSKMFKMRTGVTPSFYRNNHQKS